MKGNITRREFVETMKRFGVRYIKSFGNELTYSDCKRLRLEFEDFFVAKQGRGKGNNIRCKVY